MKQTVQMLPQKKKQNKTDNEHPNTTSMKKKDYIKDSLFHQKYSNKQAIFVSRTNYAQGSPITTPFCFLFSVKHQILKYFSMHIGCQNQTLYNIQQ